MTATYRDPNTLYRSATTYRGVSQVVGTGLPTDAIEPTDTRWFTVDGDSVYPAVPTFRFEFAFGTTAFDSQLWTTDGVWTDVTEFVHAPSGCTITRGRSTEYDGPQVGECSFTICDRSRTFDPLNIASPHHGRLQPRTPVRVTAFYDGITYPLFQGYASSFPQKYDVSDKVTWVAVTAHDAFGIIAGARWLPARPAICDDPQLGLTDYANRVSGTDPAFVEQRSGERVADLLSVLGFPAEALDLDVGQSVVRAGTVTEQDVGSHIANVVATELASYFVQPDGTIRYGERSYLDETPAALFLDTNEWALTYSALELDPLSVEELRNEITRGNGIFDPVTAKDVASAMTFGTIADERTDLLFRSPLDAKDQASHLLGLFGEPRPRIQRMDVKPRRWPRYLWPGILGWDLGTRFVIGRTPVHVGEPFVQTVSVARITHTFDSQDWTTTYYLTQPDLSAYARCDSVTTGACDAGNALAY